MDSNAAGNARTRHVLDTPDANWNSQDVIKDNLFVLAVASCKQLLLHIHRGTPGDGITCRPSDDLVIIVSCRDPDTSP